MARFKILPDFAITIFTVKDDLSRLLLAAVLAICVPFQAALAVSAGQCAALKHHESPAGQSGHHMPDPASHQGHADSGHGSGSGSDCGPCAGCCASAAISCPTSLGVHLANRNAVNALPDLPPLADMPSGLDRPPLAL
jgi:hypothetical protein